MLIVVLFIVVKIEIIYNRINKSWMKKYNVRMEVKYSDI